MKETQTPEANPPPGVPPDALGWFQTFRHLVVAQFDAVMESLRGLHQAIADFREWSEARGKAVANANIETVQNLRAYLGNIETHILTHATRMDERLTECDDRNRERAQAMGETNAEHTKSILRAIGDVERRQLAHGKALTDLEAALDKDSPMRGGINRIEGQAPLVVGHIQDLGKVVESLSGKVGHLEEAVLSLTNQPAEHVPPDDGEASLNELRRIVGMKVLPDDGEVTPDSEQADRKRPHIPVRVILDGKVWTIIAPAGGGISPSDVRKQLRVKADDVLMVRRRTVSTTFDEVDHSVDTSMLLEEGDQFVTLPQTSAYRQRDALLAKQSAQEAPPAVFCDRKRYNLPSWYFTGEKDVDRNDLGNIFDFDEGTHLWIEMAGGMSRQMKRGERIVLERLQRFHTSP